ncbi:hypothetical protein QR680_019417 [Steinernema hermaphroditum]|uniref:Uncharacterized protein n=1 Tax=Steinernema hermaphroditum TaxID=289476 RepID=A0AA39GMS1_9BILA|nr:hypothetical protein QR680_019417 [Steinernema hermaphroditum]
MSTQKAGFCAHDWSTYETYMIKENDFLTFDVVYAAQCTVHKNPYNDHDDGETFYNGYYEGQDFDTDYYDGALYLYNHNYDREAIDNDYDDEAFY